jgi:hypothetical protein
MCIQSDRLFDWWLSVSTTCRRRISKDNYSNKKVYYSFLSSGF